MARIKQKKEIEYLKRAARLTVDIFDKISCKIKVGLRESDIASDIENIIKQKGYRRSFRTIVASGPNSAEPHARLTKRRFRKNDSIVVDFGVIYRNYRADMTRTYILGKNKKLEFLYKTVKAAQGKAIKKIKSGVRISEVTKAANDFIRERALGKYILHSLGHGIGLRVHEAPKLSEKNKSILKKGMVVTVEPGLYIKGLGGVRIEDMVLVKKDGCKLLTR